MSPTCSSYVEPGKGDQQLLAEAKPLEASHFSILSISHYKTSALVLCFPNNSFHGKFESFSSQALLPSSGSPILKASISLKIGSPF